jgi:hypothetical protein
MVSLVHYVLSIRHTNSSNNANNKTVYDTVSYGVSASVSSSFYFFSSFSVARNGIVKKCGHFD